MAGSITGGGKFSPEMNVTPLIDVLLVLLVIFMVVPYFLLVNFRCYIQVHATLRKASTT